jgi:hypothetical protein
MTISTTNIRNDYTGNGATVTFPYTYKVFASSELRVLVDGVLQTITTHYTVTGVGAESGGNVVFVTAPANGVSVAILATIPLTQTTDLVNETGFFQDRIEQRFDKLCRADQLAAEELSRALTLPEDEAGSSVTTTLPSLDDRKGKTLAFDATTGQPVTMATSDAAISAAMQPVVQAATLALARTAMGISTAMDPVVTAASLAAARTAMGPWGDALVTSTGSTTSRSIADRGAEFVSAKDFGAIGNGTADDTAAINSALGTGRCVELSPGTYKITSTITLANGSGLVAKSPGVVIQQSGVGYNLITVPDGVNDWVISGLTIDGAAVSSATEDYAIACMPGDDSRRGKVIGNRFTGTNNGILLGSGSGWYIAGNEFDGLIGDISGTGYGVLCAETASRNIVHGNLFIGSAGNGRHAVYISVGATHNRVSDNIVISFNHSAFVCRAEAAQAGVYHNVISGNTIEGGGTLATAEDSGINIGGKASFNVVENNLIRDFQNDSISVNDQGHGGLTIDNIIRSNSIFNSAYCGITIIGAKRTLIVGNNIRNSSTSSAGVYADVVCHSTGTFGSELCDGTKIIGNIIGGGVGRVAFQVNGSVPLPLRTILASNILMASTTPGSYVELNGATITDSNNVKNDGP